MSRREQRRLEEGEDEEGGASPSAMSLLQDILKLEEIDEGIYRGFTPVFHGLVRVFGGQTIGQALYAAGKTVSDEMVRSLLLVCIVPSPHPFIRPSADSFIHLSCLLSLL